jgi:hypothetical protein
MYQCASVSDASWNTSDFVAPEMEGCPKLALKAYADVLQDRQVREYGGDLERPDHSPSCDLRGLLIGDVDALETDLAACKGEEPCYQIENSRFTGPVRADQRVNRTFPDLQIDVVYRDEPLEFLRQVARFKN